MKTPKMYCIYHSRDLDGWMSAAIVKLWYRSVKGTDEGLELIGWDYGQPIPVLMTDRSVVMVDISFPIEEMKRIAKNANGELTWIDHHKSAIEEFMRDDLIEEEQWLDCELPKMEMGEPMELVGACELTWRHFFPKEEMPKMVEMLGSYDSFRFKGTTGEELVHSYQYWARAEMSNPEECEYYLLMSHDMMKSIRHGEMIRKYLQVEAKQQMQHARPVEMRFDGKVGNYVQCLALNRARFNPNNYEVKCLSFYQVFISYFQQSDGKWNVSLYSIGDIDVSKIAKQYGGGGHKGAAGFIADDLDWMHGTDLPYTG